MQDTKNIIGQWTEQMPLAQIATWAKAAIHRLQTLESELALVRGQSSPATPTCSTPLAWMRRWAFDGEKPSKERNANGRLSWPAKFKLREVTPIQCLPDDIPLFPAVRHLQWVPVAQSLPEATKRSRGGWMESARVIVKIKNKDDTPYAAFAVRTASEAIPHDWCVEGHNGNWNERVVAWCEIPPLD
jgi:hypothetical protein